ncbi:malonate decarboxylase subunit delta [Bacillus sp. FJAT-45350]|uniref:malonate decarboxylase subunit delta n=1 Tax=Bacillus sp. FJAT-45350 TaxID=2011014 RepID=UPI000BB6E863|nr:malonate decarboxylase subunit delta [Bacillus sp. FJAT-45350]
MEKLSFQYKATKTLSRQAYVGVVGSGDLEILLEPLEDQQTEVLVRTSVNGFQEIWEAVLERFFATNDFAAKVEINDFGATPGVVSLRLAQAVEVAVHE